MEKKDIALLISDLEDVKSYNYYTRCRVCGHLVLDGWCCLECDWNGSEDDVKYYKLKYKNDK